MHGLKWPINSTRIVDKLDFSGLRVGDGGVAALCHDMTNGRRVSELNLSRTVLSRAAAANLLRTLEVSEEGSAVQQP